MSWLGTPYHNHATVKGIGCDCYGLIRGVYGRITNFLPPLFYPYDNAHLLKNNTVDLYKSHLENYMIEIVDQPFTVGDIIFFSRTESHPVHCGILIDAQTMVHSFQEHAIRKVVKTKLSAIWRSRYHSRGRYRKKPIEVDGKWQLLF